MGVEKKIKNKNEKERNEYIRLLSISINDSFA